MRLIRKNAYKRGPSLPQNCAEKTHTCVLPTQVISLSLSDQPFFSLSLSFTLFAPSKYIHTFSFNSSFNFTPTSHLFLQLSFILFHFKLFKLNKHDNSLPVFYKRSCYYKYYMFNVIKVGAIFLPKLSTIDVSVNQRLRKHTTLMFNTMTNQM